MIRDAATCDTPRCLALWIEPDAEDEDADTLIETATALAAAGWHWELRPLAEGGGHFCPSCSAGRGPVRERGECLHCTGLTVDRPEGAVCRYCGTVTPHPGDGVSLDV